jgi:outer membrane receptor protein involved in Fe transport
MTNTLDKNYRIDANYNREIVDGFDGFANLSLSHSGDRLQANGVTAQPYDLLSLTLGVRHANWELAFVGNNLTDERGPTFVGNNGPVSGSGPTPRTLGLRFRLYSQ